MPVVLGGGGSARDEARILDYFAWLVGADGRVLYLPVAAKDADTDPKRYANWIASILPPRGLRVAAIWSSLTGHSPEALDSFDAVFLGGGNTFKLLHQLRASGFADSIVAFCQSGRTVYGGSAGAIVLGRDIESCISYDTNLVGLTDTRGLDLCAGNSVWCHFEHRQEAVLAQHVRDSGESLIVLGKAAGALVTGEKVLGLGDQSGFLLSPARRVALQPAAIAG